MGGVTSTTIIKQTRDSLAPLLTGITKFDKESACYMDGLAILPLFVMDVFGIIIISKLCCLFQGMKVSRCLMFLLPCYSVVFSGPQCVH